MKTEKYEHHGKEVSVVSAVKGMHREHCLCFACKNFIPEDREVNCNIANAVFENCVKFHLVTPVYECPEYEQA